MPQVWCKFYSRIVDRASNRPFFFSEMYSWTMFSASKICLAVSMSKRLGQFERMNIVRAWIRQIRWGTFSNNLELLFSKTIVQVEGRPPHFTCELSEALSPQVVPMLQTVSLWYHWSARFFAGWINSNADIFTGRNCWNAWIFAWRIDPYHPVTNAGYNTRSIRSCDSEPFKLLN